MLPSRCAQTIEEQLNHLQSSPDEIKRFTGDFKVYLAQTSFNSTLFPQSANSTLFPQSVGSISEQNNLDWFMDKCGDGEYPYRSDLANTVECLECPVGKHSKAGDKACFK